MECSWFSKYNISSKYHLWTHIFIWNKFFIWMVVQLLLSLFLNQIPRYKQWKHYFQYNWYAVLCTLCISAKNYYVYYHRLSTIISLSMQLPPICRLTCNDSTADLNCFTSTLEYLHYKTKLCISQHVISWQYVYFSACMHCLLTCLTTVNNELSTCQSKSLDYLKCLCYDVNNLFI